MRIKKIIAAILALTMFCTTVAFAVTETDGTFGDELTPEQYDFIYNERNYGYSIGHGAVIVALKKGVTVDDVDFSELDIKDINIANSEMFEEGEMDNLVLMLKIDVYSRKEVVSVINVLKENPSVLYAEPLYTYYDIETIDIAQAYGARIKGDINFDGCLNNADIIILARYIVRLTSFTYSQIQAADMNNDNHIGNSDLILLAKKVVGLKR